MAQNHHQWTSSSVLPPFNVYGLFGNTNVECQLGSVVRSPEQVIHAQYNQGFRNNKKFFIQNPHNLFRQQTTPPSFANNQRVPKKSSLKLLLEFFFINQSEGRTLCGGLQMATSSKLSINHGLPCVRFYTANGSIVHNDISTRNIAECLYCDVSPPPSYLSCLVLSSSPVTYSIYSHTSYIHTFILFYIHTVLHSSIH